jgi:hypothetical protein
MKIHALVALLFVLAVSGCANLKGIPAGLDKSDKQNLAAQDLKTSLTVALTLSDRYEQARNDNLNYVYWSNVPFIPAAGVAAAAVYYKAHRDLLAGVGILAGTLAGFNAFTNARPNARVYQTGIEALSCVHTKLGIYVSKKSAADKMDQDADFLAKEIAGGKVVLTKSQNLDLASAAAVNERTSNGTVVSSLASNEKLLEQALAEAERVMNLAKEEATRYQYLPSFVSDSISLIDKKVSGKITQGDVNYAELSTSILGYTVAPKVPAVPAGGAPGKPLQNPLATGGAPTPMADAVNETRVAINRLQQLTAALSRARSDFALNEREQEVAACIKLL